MKIIENCKLKIANCNGVTLIELVVATAMVSIVAVLTINFLIDKVIDNSIQSARSDLLREAQQALDTMGSDVRHSANVDSENRWQDTHAPGAPADPYSWQSSADTLILARPTVDSDNNFIYQDPFAYITHKDNLVYFVENNTLFRRTIAADVSGNGGETSCPPDTASCRSDSTLAHNIASHTFQYFDAMDNEVDPTAARSVRVTITLAKTVYNRDLEVSYQTRWVFRNE